MNKLEGFSESNFIRRVSYDGILSEKVCRKLILNITSEELNYDVHSKTNR